MVRLLLSYQCVLVGLVVGEQISCHLCRGPKFICERSHASQKCSKPEHQYCINDIENLRDGSRYVTRRCATEAECLKDWVSESADSNKCLKYDVHRLVDTHFFCSFCCMGDNCNIDTVPSQLYSIPNSTVVTDLIG